MRIATRLALSPLLLAALAAAQPRSPHDVTTYGVVYRVAGMEDALLRMARLKGVVPERGAE